jgi:CRISPR-associated protein Cas8a1/Csx13
MTTMTLSLFNPNSLLPHRAGIAGLALALSGIDPKDAPLKWEVTESEISLSWDCSDKEAVQCLIEQTYEIKDGYLNVKALRLDEQSRYVFTLGITKTFLQHNQQRKFDDQKIDLVFKVDENQPEVRESFLPLKHCYYTSDFSKIFDKKGNINDFIPLKGHNFPGLEEDFANGVYKESPENFLCLLFLPLACQYFVLPNKRTYILIIPNVINLQAWVKRRRFYKGMTVRKLTPYGEFRANGAGESALRFLLQEKLIEEANDFKVDYCEVYRLGIQPWNPKQNIKQFVYRVYATDKVLELYQNAWQLFPSVVRTTQDKDGERNWLAPSRVLPWIADNLIANKHWYEGFFEFRKANEIYERKGLIQMTNYLEPLEQTFFDAIKGGFSTYLRSQIEQANKQGRQLDYPQVTKKIVYLLQRPNTQQEFATAVVDFLSRHPSKAARGSGPEIYQWLHRDHNWRKARDLALLAIATYEGKNKQGETEVPEEILDQVASIAESESGLEMDLA